MMSDTDTPIDPAHPDATPRSKPVIDLGEWRIAYGHPRYPEKICKHRSLVYSTEERRVWCEDCQRTVDNFDAFMVLANVHHDMVNTLKRKMQKADEIQKAWLHRKAAKELDQTWGRKMAVACPHCGRGLLAEDFAGGGGTRTSRDIELARRKREKGEKHDGKF